MNELEKYLDIDYSEFLQPLAKLIKGYIDYGEFPGDLLQALLCNDLSETIRLADRYDYHVVELVRLVRFFQDEAPAACWGSPEAMELWKARRGIRG